MLVIEMPVVQRLEYAAREVGIGFEGKRAKRSMLGGEWNTQNGKARGGVSDPHFP